MEQEQVPVDALQGLPQLNNDNQNVNDDNNAGFGPMELIHDVAADEDEGIPVDNGVEGPANAAVEQQPNNNAEGGNIREAEVGNGEDEDSGMDDSDGESDEDENGDEPGEVWDPHNNNANPNAGNNDNEANDNLNNNDNGVIRGGVVGEDLFTLKLASSCEMVRRSSCVLELLYVTLCQMVLIIDTLTN